MLLRNEPGPAGPFPVPPPEEPPWDSVRALEALRRMNWAHGHYQLANSDFLYVLTTFIFEPIRWIAPSLEWMSEGTSRHCPSPTP